MELYLLTDVQKLNKSWITNSINNNRVIGSKYYSNYQE